MRKGCLLLVLTVTLFLTSVGKTWAAEFPWWSPTQVSCSGKALDSQGEAVAGATVVLYYQTSVNRSSPSKMERIGERVTDSQGAFRLTAPRDPEGRRAGFVIARKEGLAFGWTMWRAQENQQANVVLREARELTGSVVDENGRPVADAEVCIAMAVVSKEGQRSYLSAWPMPQALAAKTDSSGRFAFSDTPAEATFELQASKPGRATVCTYDPMMYRGDRYQFSPGQADIRMTLPVEARIEGQVVEKIGGKPVGGGQVLAQHSQPGQSLSSVPTTVAKDGTFSVGALPPGGCTVLLMTPTEGPAEWVADPVVVDLKAGETTRDVKLLVGKGGLVEVVIKEEESDKPIEKADVGASSAVNRQWYGGTTDATGLARIRVPAGSYTLRSIYKQGYARSMQQEAFTIEDGQTKQFGLMLSSLPSIRGVVYDDAGKPLEGVEVQVLPGAREKTTSDAQGKFKATWDPANWGPTEPTRYLIARHAQWNLATAELAGEPGSQMEVKLWPGLTLTGQVTDPNGKPIAGADIQIMFRASTWGSSFLPYRGVKTDAQGRYEVGAIPPEQRYDVIASADDYGQAQTNIDATGAADNRAQVSTLTLAVANMSVSGVVVDSTGQPVSGADVRSYMDPRTGQPTRQTRTDAEGRFTLDRICAGQIRLSAQKMGQAAGGYLIGSLQIEAGATDARIVVAERVSSGVMRTVPRRPTALRGRPLPDLTKLGIEPPVGIEGKMLLVCFWDMNQRPSRHVLTQLTAQAAQLGEKGVTIIAVQAGKVEQDALSEWTKTSQIPFVVGSITGDAEKAQLDWGVASLPHLILTDKEHVVAAEGFSLGELEKKIEEAASR